MFKNLNFIPISEIHTLKTGTYDPLLSKLEENGLSIVEIWNDEIKITAYWKCAKPLWDNDQDVTLSQPTEFDNGET